MRILIFLAIILHILFLLSVFYIYFKSIIVPGLEPLKDLENPPAKRLVLIVTDGLRAESFFHDDCNRTLFLRKTMLEQGIIGISHTRVPTESRPGHVALIAGVYEDPSSLFKGWKENPVEFDSLFNRSHITYAWGSPDILPMFAKGASSDKVITECYNAAEEVFGSGSKTHLLDQWVFRRVKKFLKKPENVESLRKETKMVLFLHLLGLDTSGHVHKPNSQKYTDNLKFVDRGIRDIVELIEETFENDGQTAFIVTSDHGMTNRGSHGSGHALETETPFLAWGAGVNYWLPASEDFISRHFITIGGQKIPRYDIQQADACPLMATLIGVAVPTNNFGKLPYMYPNVSKEYLAQAFSNNAYQLHAQYQKLHQQSLQKTFRFSFNLREGKIEDEIVFLDEQIRLSYTLKDYDDIIVLSNKMINAIHEGIDFYQMYYKNELLIALTLTMIAWVLLLYQYIITSRIKYRISSKLLKIGGVFAGLIVAYNSLQHAPLVVIGYFLLPIPLWMLVLNNNENSVLKNLIATKSYSLCGLLCIGVAELLVFSFFQRKILSLVLLLYTGAITSLAIKKKIGHKIKILKYFSSAVCLGIFPLLAVVEKDTKNSILLILGTVFWIFRSFDYAYLKRFDKISIAQSILMLFGGLFFLYLVISFVNNDDIALYQQFVSWILLFSPILTIFGSLNMEIRLKAIGNGFSLPFILMSLSYEPLFLLSFFIHLVSWVEMELIVCRRNKQLKELVFEEQKNERKRDINFNDLRSALVFMLYLLIAFFGTGNMATISSFDPNWVRCLVKTFSPFLMATLIIFKLIIPINLLSCCYRAIHVALRVNAKKHFMLMLIICDIMCLNFLFLVKNKGSWLDIGTSLSHFIIMEATVLVLILFYGIAQLLTTFQIKFQETHKNE